MNPTWESDDGSVKLYRGDARDVLPTLPDSSVSLIATDPPYYKVKGEAWDQQWDKPAAFLSWLGGFLDEFRRVLAPNGSLYVFASPQMAWGVEGEVRKRFAMLNRITWLKSDGHGTWDTSGGKWRQACKDGLRGYFPRTETILFAEHFNADNAADNEAGYTAACERTKRSVFGDYMRGEFTDAGVTQRQIAALFPSASGGMTGCVSNWLLGYNCPTPEQYQRMREFLNTNGDAHLRREYAHLRREYEDLRREYEDLRREYEDLRRPFNARADAPYTDVWDFPTVAKYPGKHPCEKPLAMMEHIVELSSRPGDVVLDCFAGGCSTGQAAKKHGRQFIGIEQAEQYFASSVRRIQRQEQDERQPTLFDLKPERPTQEELFP